MVVGSLFPAIKCGASSFVSVYVTVCVSRLLIVSLRTTLIAIVFRRFMQLPVPRIKKTNQLIQSDLTTNFQHCMQYLGMSAYSTCRRYWTKGGALRNVPIGGGCRKNKGSIVSSNSIKTNSNGKIRTASPDIVKSSLGFGYDQELTPSSHNQIIWPSQQPQSSQLLALLKANTPNPNPNRNPNSIKEEGNMIGSHMMSDSSVTSMGSLNGRSLSLDPMANNAPFSLCSSFWRNNSQQQAQQQQQQGFLVGEVQNTGIQELYQRLRSSANYYSSDNSSASVLNSVATTASTNSSSMFEPAATVIAGGELSYSWNNPSFNWSNLSTTNGAFP
ncbi:hypothetical protein C5167_014524 [Papaver somniferum]|uniref:Dof-type domain-containing protein n=1 Tax=Papaver somniferum TaxID=3469 RepID=A0A4Y7J7C1_PAPSO|nr:hypothetical protein C5167_014524 [Papaver somniferum]